MSRSLLCGWGAIARRSRTGTINVNGSQRRQSNCNETGYLHCLRCKRSYVEGCVRTGRCDARPFHVQNQSQRAVFLVRWLFFVCVVRTMRGPSRPRRRSHGKLSGCSVRRQQNVAALFLQHIARLWMHCAGESARSNGATVVQAMSWQTCVGACRYAAQTSQAEGFWHGRIVAYTGVGCIAGDASFIIAKTQTLQSTTESHASYHARVVSLCLSIFFVLQCLCLWMQCLVQVCLSA